MQIKYKMLIKKRKGDSLWVPTWAVTNYKGVKLRTNALTFHRKTKIKIFGCGRNLIYNINL